MAAKRIVFLHGFASSDRATKAKYIAERLEPLPDVAFHAINFNPTPADFEYLTPTGMIDRLRQFVLDRDLEPFSIVASSLGGLVAVHYAHRYGNVEKMLLLAPLLRWSSIWDSEAVLARWEETGTLHVPHYALPGQPPLRFDFQVDGRRYREGVAPAAPVVIVHSRDDEIVPVAGSQAYAQDYPDRVRLLELKAAGHDMNDHLPTIWDQVQSFILES
ncbi:MAG TPA: YqiA/YcfP family alpha/beta fold hydrolase [Anaerolineae bacterium]|nr:YqiA/YcfP family alpha/beta fold hydrolase [Anaerolineae bacterium]